jgi:hypothetical protein
MSFSSIASPVKSSLGIKASTYNDGQDSSPLPYDAEVEYLESTGTQWMWIKLPVSVDNSATVNMTGYVGMTNRELFSFDKSNITQFNIETGSTYYRWWSWSPINLGSGFLNSLHSYKCNSSIWVDGVLKGTITPTMTHSTQDLYILNGTHGATSGRIYHVSVEYGGRLIFDAIPVRVDTIGYLYDRVSGELFRNQGTGSFIIGPDL